MNINYSHKSRSVNIFSSEFVISFYLLKAFWRVWLYHKMLYLFSFCSIAFGFPGGSDGKESTCNAGDLGSIPGLGRSPGGGHGNPLQYSCLENPMDREAWGRGLCSYSPRGRRVRYDWATKHSTASLGYSWQWLMAPCFPPLSILPPEYLLPPGISLY